MERISLVAIGRRSGRPRAVTLYAFDHVEGLVVVGSKGGSASDPDWVMSLRATPRATVRLGAATWPVKATEADGAERDQLWDLVAEAFPLYLTYQRRTTRVIPLFVLAPAEADGGT